MFETVALYWPPRVRPIKKEAKADPEKGVKADVEAAVEEAQGEENGSESDPAMEKNESPGDVTPKSKEKKDGFLAWTLGGDICEVLRRSPAGVSGPVVEVPEGEEDIEAKLELLERLAHGLKFTLSTRSSFEVFLFI